MPTYLLDHLKSTEHYRHFRVRRPDGDPVILVDSEGSVRYKAIDDTLEVLFTPGEAASLRVSSSSGRVFVVSQDETGQVSIAPRGLRDAAVEGRNLLSLFLRSGEIPPAILGRGGKLYVALSATLADGEVPRGADLANPDEPLVLVALKASEHPSGQQLYAPVDSAVDLEGESVAISSQGMKRPLSSLERRALGKDIPPVRVHQIGPTPSRQALDSPAPVSTPSVITPEPAPSPAGTSEPPFAEATPAPPREEAMPSPESPRAEEPSAEEPQPHEPDPGYLESLRQQDDYGPPPGWEQSQEMGGDGLPPPPGPPPSSSKSEMDEVREWRERLFEINMTGVTTLNLDNWRERGRSGVMFAGRIVAACLDESEVVGDPVLEAALFSARLSNAGHRPSGAGIRAIDSVLKGTLKDRAARVRQFRRGKPKYFALPLANGSVRLVDEMGRPVQDTDIMKSVAEQFGISQEIAFPGDFEAPKAGRASTMAKKAKRQSY